MEKQKLKAALSLVRTNPRYKIYIQRPGINENEITYYLKDTESNDLVFLHAFYLYNEIRWKWKKDKMSFTDDSFENQDEQLGIK